VPCPLQPASPSVDAAADMEVDSAVYEEAGDPDADDEDEEEEEREEEKEREREKAEEMASEPVHYASMVPPPQPERTVAPPAEVSRRESSPPAVAADESGGDSGTDTDGSFHFSAGEDNVDS
jgi:hypothetical protein